MLRSKATAVLMRLKEMDRKYNIKQKEGRRAQSNISTESSLENTPRNPPPEAFGNNEFEVVQAFPDTNSEDKIIAKVFPGSKMKVPVVSPYVSGDEMSEKANEYLKEPVGTSAKINTEVSELENETDKSVSKIEYQKTALKIRGSGDFQRYSEESSVATLLSNRSTPPETISEAIKSMNDNVQEAVIMESNVLTDNEETTIDEVIRISGERSEMVSELRNATEDDDSILSADEQRLKYDNDTFEEASTSTSSSESMEEYLEKYSDEVEHDAMMSGVKEIKITPHKKVESVQEVFNHQKDKEIVELIPAKIIQSVSECEVGLDEELSNYVESTKNVDEVLPINLLKLSKQATPVKKHARRSKKHRKSSDEYAEEQNDSSVASDRVRLTEAKVNKGGAALKENSSSASIGKSERKKRKESAKVKKVAVSIERPPSVAEAEVEKESSPLSRNEVEYEEPESISSEKLLREIPKKSDVTSTLRELNKDAINAIVRRQRMHATSKPSDKSRQCKNCRGVVKLPSTEYETPENMENDESKSASIDNIDSNHEQKIRGKKAKSKRISKAAKIRRTTCQSKMEEKRSRFDCRQNCRLRRQTAALRMQQERADIRNYMLELESTRLGFRPGEPIACSKYPAFKPLDFPKIAAFEKPDFENPNWESRNETDVLQEKISTIRQWLKDQYHTYRDYSKLAQTVNAKYVPASLEDAKRTIRQLQRATIESR